MDAAIDDAIRVQRGVAAQRHFPEDIVDITGVTLIEADSSEGDPIGDRKVDHPFELAADAAMSDRIDLAVDPAARHSELGLVGDDADGARFA